MVVEFRKKKTSISTGFTSIFHSVYGVNCIDNTYLLLVNWLKLASQYEKIEGMSFLFKFGYIITSVFVKTKRKHVLQQTISIL